jgi:cold shock CspA family protein
MGDEALALRELGVVKWFGGFNKKTNRENDFGFIESLEGEDVFLHQSSLPEGFVAVEGDKITFVREQSDRGPKAHDVRLFSPSDEGLVEQFQALKAVEDCSKGTVYSTFQGELEEVLFSLQPDLRQQILKQLFNCKSDMLLLDRFLRQTTVYRDLLQIYGLETLIDLGVDLDSIPAELVQEQEEEICRLICSGRLSKTPDRFIRRSNTPVLHACALVDLLEKPLPTDQKNELYGFLREKFMNPKGTSAALYQDIFADCVKRIGGYKASPVVWDILSELLLKKFLFDQDFHKAESLYNSHAGLSRKIDCFIVLNLAQLLVAGNDLQTTYNIFVHTLWQAMATKQVDVESQASRILSLFPSCGTMRLSDVPVVENPQDRDDPFDLASWPDDDPLPKGPATEAVRNPARETKLSCEAVYWEKEEIYLCRGSVCSNPQIRLDPKRNFLEFSIYDWLVHFGVEFWGSDDHRLRDFPIKLAGYLNRLREIMPHLRCRSCSELMLPDFKYSRVKCFVYENGIRVEKDMAAAYRNTVFYCNNASCSDHGEKHYINHCLGYLCFDLIDSRDLKVRCDGGKLVCKGCGGCCGEHAKSNPVGLCSECGSSLELYEDPGRRSRFGRNERFVQCSNSNCGFKMSEPGLPKKFYLKTCQPVHKAREVT